jgi:hypothetical protein
MAINLSTSISLQIILSIFHSLASLVKSVEKKSSAGVVDSEFLFVLGFLFLSKGVEGSLFNKF